MSVFDFDREQLIDQRGNPIVNASVFIGEASRDPEIFPKLAYSDQERTVVIGSEIKTDAYGRLPKIYIEPPYSYRVRLEDGSQHDEQLYSFGIVEIDYTPNGSGVEAINVGGDFAPEGGISQDMLDEATQELLARIGINSGDLAQEVNARLRAQAILAVQDSIDGVASTQETIVERVSEAENTAASQLERITATENDIRDVYGDGTNIEITAFATEQQSIASAVNNPTTGLDATRNLINTTDARLDSLSGGATARSIEQLNADLEQLETSVASGAEGMATVQSVQEVDLRVDGLSQQLDNVDGNGLTLEALAANTDTINTNLQTTNGLAQSGVTQSQAANTRIDNITDEPAINAIASDLTTVEALVGNDANSGLRATVAQQSTAISDLENGVASQWEVKASANDVTGSIGLYNDNGDTKVLLKADQIVADRGNGEESLFDADGLLDDEFSRHSYVSDDSGDIAVAPDTIQQFPALAMTLERGGVYRYTFYLGYRAQTFPSTRDIRLLVSSGVTDAITFSSSTASTKYAKDAVFLRDSTFAFQPSIPATQVSVGILQFTDDGVGRGEPVKIEGVIEISNTIATATADLQLIISYTSENNQNLNLFDSRKLIYEKIN